ncbi:MAG: PAS domain S-box protein, partial [Deltaproteobacteria bacterium]|nr:PAS domain S-box protein [Deltaproteobacteria bacterium]
MFETMAQGVVYQDADGKVTSANYAAERILGLTLAQMQDRMSIDPRWKTVHEDGSGFPGEPYPSMVALSSGEETLNVMMGVFDPRDDAYRWINVSAVPQFRPGESTPYQVYTTFADITERVRAEEQVRHLRNYLKNIIDSMPSVLVGVDLENRVTQWNREAEKMTGVMAGEAQGRMLSDVLPELAGEMEKVQRAIQNREPQKDEKMLRESDGEIRYSDVTVYPLVA